jgi:C1A family cysteine protease
MQRITRREFTKRALAVPITASMAPFLRGSPAQADDSVEAQPRQLFFGWKPESPEYAPERAFLVPPTIQSKPLEKSVDLRDEKTWPEPYFQGNLNSCVANAVAFAVWYVRYEAKEKHPFPPSRLFLYYFARAKEHTVNQNAAIWPSSAFDVLRHYGVCPEKEWPYDEGGGAGEVFKPGSIAAQQPTQKAIDDAKPHIDILDHGLRTLEDMQRCLMARLPFVFGFYVYSSFYKEGTYDPVRRTGKPKVVIPYPKEGDINTGEGHCVVAVGYNENNQFMCRNSWGPNVQEKGYFYMPFDYLTDPRLSQPGTCLQRVQAIE